MGSGLRWMLMEKSAHWLFDRGFWSITDDYTVVVKSCVSLRLRGRRVGFGFAEPFMGCVDADGVVAGVEEGLGGFAISD